MNFLEAFEDYPYFPGIAVILMGILIFIIKLKAINNEEFNEKLSNSQIGSVGIWGLIAGLILWGIKLLYASSQY